VKAKEITNDKLIDMMYEIIPKHPSGTYFYWSISILHRSILMCLIDGMGHLPFDSNSRFPHLYGIPVQWDRTDMEIELKIKKKKIKIINSRENLNE